MLPSPPSTSARSVGSSASAPSRTPSCSSMPCFSASAAGTSTSTPRSRASASSRPTHSPVCSGYWCVNSVMRSGFFTAPPAAPRPRPNPRRRAPALGEPDEALLVPRRARQPGGGVAEHGVPLRGGPLTDRDERRPPVVRRAHDAALPHLLAPDLELRLDQREAVPPSPPRGPAPPLRAPGRRRAAGPRTPPSARGTGA